MAQESARPSRDLSLRRLAIFAAVSRLGSMSAAALEIGVGQPAVSSAVAKLEADLGERLLERGVAGAALTEAGAIVARRLHRMAEQLEAAVRRASGVDAGRAALAVRALTSVQVRGHRAVAGEGSFRAAAALLGVSEPSLHRTVRSLETLLGVGLYQRTPRGFSCSQAGDEFARELGVALKEMDQARDELGAASGRAASRIAIGCLPLTPKLLLARALSLLVADGHRVDVSIEEGAYAALRCRLDFGDLDMIVGALRQQPDSLIVEQSLFSDAYVVAARAGHPLRQQCLGPHHLALAKWVAAARDTPRRTALESFFQTLPTRPDILLETSSLDMAVAALREGDCLTLICKSQLRDQIDPLLNLGSVDERPVRVVGVTTRRGWLATPIQVAYLSWLNVSAETYAA